LIVTEKPQGYRIGRASGAAQRIGFENGWGKPLKTLWVRRMCTQTVYRTAGLDPSAPHECEVVFKLAQRIIPDACAPRDPDVLAPILLDVPPQRGNRIGIQVTDKWERLGAHARDVVRLIQAVAARNPTRLFGAASERAYCEQIEGACNAPVEIFDTLHAWKDAIATCRGLVAPDSGAVHVAGMIGTPVLACFAAQRFALQSARWAPWAAPYQIVRMHDDGWPVVAADALDALLNGSPYVAYKG
ncbi:MAG TPA: glycosyltransferase family 9 protein, partial [Candidatus Baltobacteraceae bacterium]|nr:glycosyltransferase family 9 protein [Candidatus Baltobacteraceae bacterium]